MITVDEITLDDFKSWFMRDFSYSTPIGDTTPIYDCPKEYVTDSDITKAYTEASMNFNPGLFSTDAELKMCYLYLSAHYLVNDLQTSAAGVSSTGYFAVNSRSVGSVSESYTIPEWMMADPILGAFSTTRYGQKYLSLIKPLLVGNVTVYMGGTTFW